MAMQLVLSQRLEQRLKMTAQMIQSIEMLQLPVMALQEQINQQLTENPVLEVVEEEQEVPPGLAERQENEEKESDFERLEKIARDEEWEEALYSSTRPRSSSYGDEDPKTGAMQNTAARATTLQEHVAEEVRLSEAPERTREIAEQLAFDLDDNGYLLVPPEEVFEGKEEPPAPVTSEEGEAALSLIRSLDPPGVGARTVEECLLLQLARLDGKHDLEKRIIGERFDDILHNRLPKAAKDLGVTIEEVKEAIAHIARLDPRPGRAFAVEMPRYITPDVIVEERDGDYQISLNDSFIPNVRISPIYRALLKQEKRGSPTRDYLRQKLQSAKWLIDSVAQRRSTMLKITTEVLGAQREFFDEGVSHLRPLQMKDVADRIGMHVSTVSRAIAGKYMDTPQGLFPMRYFFTGGYETGAQGEAISDRYVKSKVRDIVHSEDKTRPLSDAEVAGRLAREGIKIARRTVAKYREKLGIPASRQRRQY